MATEILNIRNEEAGASSTTPVPVQTSSLRTTAMSAEDVEFWSDHCLPAFQSLLKSTGSYNGEQLESHVNFFKRSIIPHIGPKPKAGADFLLAHTGSILETSINFTDVGAPIVRFIFQPQDIDGIPQDIGADMTWFNQLASVFYATEQEMPILRSKLPPSIANIPQCLLGFDLNPSKRSMKGYFAPLYKRLLSGEDTDGLVFKHLRKLEPLGRDFDAALAKLESFRAEEKVGNIDVIGVDCINPTDGARIKLYSRLPPSVNNFDYVAHHLTLGGRLTNETVLEQVELLRGVWHLLLDEPEGFTEKNVSKDEIGVPDPHSGIMISWEVQPGKDSPSPKLYVPRWKFSASNKNIVQSYQEIFKKWGWSWGEGTQYASAIERAFGQDGVSDNTPVVHTYTSFNLSKKKGKYLTSYTSPILEKIN